VKTGATPAGVLPSQADQPASAFAEKSAVIILTVIKRNDAFAVTEHLTDGE
jgi:hypothetical protein